MFGGGLFGFLSMADDYDKRKVDNYTDGDIQVDTCAVTDSQHQYETGLSHPSYNGGDWVIVAVYDDRESAQAGHDFWVQSVKNNSLPREITDVSSCTIARLADSMGVEFRTKPKTDLIEGSNFIIKEQGL